MKHLFQTLPRNPLLMLLLILSSAVATQAQDARLQLSGLDQLAAKAKETVDVSVDERMIKIVTGVLGDKPDEAEAKKLLAGLKGVYVKIFEFEKASDFNVTELEVVRSQLRNPSWSKLVVVSSKGQELVEVHLHMTGEQVGGLALLAVDDNEVTVINIVGPIDLEKLSKLEGKFGIPGLDIEVPKVKKNDQ